MRHIEVIRRSARKYGTQAQAEKLPKRSVPARREPLSGHKKPLQSGRLKDDYLFALLTSPSTRGRNKSAGSYR